MQRHLPFAALLLASCTAMPDAWDQRPTLAPLPAVVVRVTPAEVTAICGKATMGCAHRDYIHGVCVIYTEYRPLPETIPHELLHCAGVEHRP